MAVSRNLLQFARRILRRAAQARTGFSKTHQDVAVRTVAALYEATPKDTTLAASSWVAQVGAPSTFKPLQPVGLGAVLGRARDAVAGSRGDARIWITNNQEYIRRLNDGYSRQAPAMFVQRAFLAGRTAASNLRLFTKG